MKTNLGDKPGKIGCSQIMESLECHIQKFQLFSVNRMVL